MRDRIRRYGWVLAIIVVVVAGVWVFDVSRAGTRAEGCPIGCASAGERREGPLRVMSLNVLHGFPRFQRLSERLDLLAEEIGAQDADIVCLQEVPWTRQLGSGAAYLAERTGLNHLYLRANGNRWAMLFEEGEAILSRFPLDEVRITELKPQAGFFEHRVVLEATASTPWGDVRVFVTHLTNGSPEVNRAQAESLMAFVAVRGEGAAIVAGDFNATEDSPQIVAITDEWVDTYRVANLVEDGLTCCVDNLSFGPEEPLEERIDYVFLVPDEERVARVASSRRVLDTPFESAGGWLWASDHVGLLTAIRVTP